MRRPRFEGPLREWAEFYVTELGWGLCSMEPRTKGPSTKGWNTPCRWLDTVEKVAAHWRVHPDWGMGLIHAASGTVAVDVDALDHTRMIFGAFDLDLARLLAPAARIRGAVTGRDKAIFAAPPGAVLPIHKAQWRHPTGTAVALFELRAGAVHDVLPPSVHPAGHRYAWLRAPWELADGLPQLPNALLALWRTFSDHRDRIQQMAPWATPAAERSEPRGSRRSSNRQHDIIGAFNRAHSVESILRANGYKKRGKRFLAPGSTTGIPGVNLLDDGKCYSHHASDPLGDGHAHDAFDLYCLFDHQGNVAAAVRSAADAMGISDSRGGTPPLVRARPAFDWRKVPISTPARW